MEELQCVMATPGLEVYRDEARGWLYTRWLGVHTEATIEQAINAVCGYLRENIYTKILSDHSGLIGKWPEESPWVMPPYFEALARHGITYFAWVYNDGYHNRAMMEQVLHSAGRPAVAIFKDVASAYEWLQHSPTVPVERPRRS